MLSYKLPGVILVILILLCSFYSCKKKKTDIVPEVGTMPIILVDSNVSSSTVPPTPLVSTYYFVYNSDKRLDSLHITKKFMSSISSNDWRFYYFPDSIIEVGNSSVDTFIHQIDSLGRITRSYEGWYTYYSNTNKVSGLYYPLMYFGQKPTYFWEDDNLMVSVGVNEDTTWYEYYADKPASVGDAFWIRDFLRYTKRIIYPKNLVRSIRNRQGMVSYKTDYSYTFDENNRIVQGKWIRVETENSTNGLISSDTDSYHLQY